MKVKLKDLSTLDKEGKIYALLSDRVIITDGKGSWKSISTDFLKGVIEVMSSEVDLIITEKEYETYKDLFIEHNS